MYPPAKKARLESNTDISIEDLHLDGCSSCESVISSSSSDSQLESEMERLRKPDASFIELIAKAIMEAPRQRLSLHEIYDTLSVKYPYFQFAEPTWKNSVRHNLSVNDCFYKAEKCRDGKGHYWCVHPANIEDFQRGDFRRRLMKSRVQSASRQFNEPPQTLSATVHTPYQMFNLSPVIHPNSQYFVPLYHPATQRVYSTPHADVHRFAYQSPILASTSTVHTPHTLVPSQPHPYPLSGRHTLVPSQPHPYPLSGRHTLPTKSHWSDNFASYMHPLPAPLVSGTHGNQKSRLPPLSLSGMVDLSPRGAVCGTSSHGNKARTFSVDNILSP